MRCSICKKEISGYGHNAFPVIIGGQCCDKCNEKIVIPARLFFETIKKQDYAMLILKDEIRLLKPKKKYFTLKELQEAVEGYIEVYSSCLPGYLNVVNEEGCLKNLYFNELSYKMFDTEFVGNVLVCPVRIFEKPE